MEKESKINPQPGDIAVGPVVESNKRTTPNGNIEIKVPKGVLPEGYDADNVVPVLVNRAIEAVGIIEVEIEEHIDNGIEKVGSEELIREPIERVEIEEPIKGDNDEQLESKGDEDDEKKKPVILGCLPAALITVILATSIGSCVFRENNIPNLNNPFEYTRVIERDEIEPFVEEYIEVNGPQDNATGLTGLKGQEGLTNNSIAGEENTIEGEYYSGKEHFQDEKESATGLDEFKESQEQVKTDMEDLATSDNLTQDQVSDKLKSIETETKKMEQQYAEREDLMEEGVEEFKEATMVNQDEISETEIQVAEQMKEIFDEEHERVNDNLQGVQNLTDRVQAGQEIHIDDIEYDEETGKYTITGESIEKVVEEQRYTGIQALWERFKDWVRGDSEQSIDDNQR